MTRIAILGWGSLLWHQGTLRNEGAWKADGPWLPIEFARTSNLQRRDGRGPYLSLVVHPDVGLIRTYWDMSLCAELAEARENLRVREGTAEEFTAHLSKNGKTSFKNDIPGLGQRVREWLDSKPELDAVIWTDLRWKLGGVDSFTVEAGISWLETLRTSGQDDTAKEYIRMAPSQTDTCLRRQVSEGFGWKNIPMGY